MPTSDPVNTDPTDKVNEAAGKHLFKSGPSRCFACTPHVPAPHPAWARVTACEPLTCTAHQDGARGAVAPQARSPEAMSCSPSSAVWMAGQGDGP